MVPFFTRNCSCEEKIKRRSHWKKNFAKRQSPEAPVKAEIAINNGRQRWKPHTDEKRQNIQRKDDDKGDFFELMPCTLEALTVIKTFCLWLAIPAYWRIGESKKAGVNRDQNKTNTTKNQTKTTQEDTQELGETLPFQKRNPQAAQYFSTMS